MPPQAPTDQDYATLLLELFAAPAVPDIAVKPVEPARRVSTRRKIATAKAANQATDQEQTTPRSIFRKRTRDLEPPQMTPLDSITPVKASTNTVTQEQEQHEPKEEEQDEPQHEQESLQYPPPKRRKKGSVKRVYPSKHATIKRKLWRAAGMPPGGPTSITTREAGYPVLPSWTGRPRTMDVTAAEEEKRRLVQKAIENGALDDIKKTVDAATETTTPAPRANKMSMQTLVKEGTPRRTTRTPENGKFSTEPTRRSARKTKPEELNSDIDGVDHAGSIRIGEIATPEVDKLPGYVGYREKRWLGWDNAYWPVNYHEEKKKMQQAQQAQQEASPEMQLLAEATQAASNPSPDIVSQRTKSIAFTPAYT